MKKWSLIYNPSCSKSNEALRILEESKVSFNKIDYLSGELDEEMLWKIKKLLKMNFVKLVRQKEAPGSSFLSAGELSDESWIEFILKYPGVLERPILFSDEMAIIARPPELMREFL